MKSYGQFCSIARALDLLGERWTILIVRELLCGGRTFGDVRRGIPRISKTMLSARLRELADAGVIAGDGAGYALTESGRDLMGVVGALGTWGQKWLPRTALKDELDMDALLWDMRRRVDAQRLPSSPTVVRIELTDLRRSATRWLLLRKSEVSLCGTNPGFPESLAVRTDRRTLIAWWRGDVSYAEARQRGLHVDGPAALVRAFPSWFQRYLFADVAPAGQ
jgi:DNA-binding HxlR family transcriptional regulator